VKPEFNWDGVMLILIVSRRQCRERNAKDVSLN
jgi:hypothetical protein